MKINEQNILCEDDNSLVAYRPSPNHGGELKELKFLMIHYTAGHSLKSSADWLCNPKAQASSHLIIGMDAAVVQLVPFCTVAWHAGKTSRWQAPTSPEDKTPRLYKKLNNFSIGIELDNPGRLKPASSRSTYWQACSFDTIYPPEEGLELKHKHEEHPSGWHVYPRAQIEKLLEISRVLVAHYQLEDVIGHDDVCPCRKTDPGPAFDMAEFRYQLFGRPLAQLEHLWGPCSP